MSTATIENPTSTVTPPSRPADIDVDHMRFPPKMASFVAYDRKPRVSAAGGRRLEVRAEVFISQYSSIRVKDITSSGVRTQDDGSTFETLSVKFDAASVGDPNFKHDFTANTVAGTAIAKLIEWAHQTGTPLALALETRRKVTDPKGAKIPFTTGIIALRTDENGKGNANITKDHCVKVIAAVGFRRGDEIKTKVSGEVVSDWANEWPDLYSNSKGQLPPKGWMHLTDPEDPKVSAIVPDPQAAGVVDQAAVTKATAEAVTTAAAASSVKSTPAATPPGQSARVADAAAGTEGGQRRGRAAEGSKWTPMNSDGRANAGSALLSKQRAIYFYSTDLLSVLAQGNPDLVWPEVGGFEGVVQRLTNTLLWAADRVQATVTGSANRASSSHYEAGMWLEGLVERYLPYPAEAVNDRAAHTKWVTSLIEAASEKYRAAYAAVAQSLGVEPDLPAPSAAVAE